MNENRKETKGRGHVGRAFDSLQAIALRKKTMSIDMHSLTQNLVGRRGHESRLLGYGGSENPRTVREFSFTFGGVWSCCSSHQFGCPTHGKEKK